MDIFSCKCDLVKYSCPIFRRVKKIIFVNLNTNFLQSTWWNFLKYFPQLLILVYYKILGFHVSKNVSFQKIGTCPRNDEFWSIFGKNIVKELLLKETRVFSGITKKWVMFLLTSMHSKF